MDNKVVSKSRRTHMNYVAHVFPVNDPFLNRFPFSIAVYNFTSISSSSCQFPSFLIGFFPAACSPMGSPHYPRKLIGFAQRLCPLSESLMIGTAIPNFPAIFPFQKNVVHALMPYIMFNFLNVF